MSLKMYPHKLKLDMILRGIVMTRGENGATIDEMRSDYEEIFLEQWPLHILETKQIVNYLLEIDGLMMEKLNSGLCIWYIDDIGSNISDRDMDANNNVVVTIADTLSDATASSSDNGNEPTNNSYSIQPPCNTRRMVTSSFVNEHAVSSAETLNFNETIENGHDVLSKKRKLSISNEMIGSPEKRLKSITSKPLPLLEKNLDFHNRNSGANGMVKQITSTEKENSILIHNGTNGMEVDIEIDALHVPERKSFNEEFSNRCKINEKSSTVQTDSVGTTIPTAEEELFPSYICTLGDDFMRHFFSFELYGSDFTEQDDSQFSYCNSGQTIRDAYYLVLDKANQFSSNYRYVIVNVGAIDILLERDLVDIQASYARLVKTIITMKCQPILTTIPDILVSPNNPNQKIIRQMLLLFNRFLVETFGDACPIIDLFSCIPRNKLNETNIYFHNQPKRVWIPKLNRKLDLWHWSEIGRKQILDTIDACIEKYTAE